MSVICRRSNVWSLFFRKKGTIPRKKVQVKGSHFCKGVKEAVNEKKQADIFGENPLGKVNEIKVMCFLYHFYHKYYKLKNIAKISFNYWILCWKSFRSSWRKLVEGVVMKKLSQVLTKIELKCMRDKEWTLSFRKWKKVSNNFSGILNSHSWNCRLRGKRKILGV